MGDVPESLTIKGMGGEIHCSVYVNTAQEMAVRTSGIDVDPLVFSLRSCCCYSTRVIRFEEAFLSLEGSARCIDLKINEEKKQQQKVCQNSK